jgi:hypothetical protein
VGGNGLAQIVSQILGLLDELVRAALRKHELRGSLSAEFFCYG